MVMTGACRSTALTSTFLVLVICLQSAAANNAALQASSNNVKRANVAYSNVAVSSAQGQNVRWMNAPSAGPLRTQQWPQASSGPVTATSVSTGSSWFPSTVLRGKGGYYSQYKPYRGQKHWYPAQAIFGSAPPGAAALMGPYQHSSMTLTKPAVQNGISSTSSVYIPGKGWATVIWGEPKTLNGSSKTSPGSPGSQQPAGVDDDDDNGGTMTQPGSMVSPPSPGRSSGSWGTGSGDPLSPGMPSTGMWPARKSSPRPAPTVVAGPSKTQPGRPLLIGPPSPSPAANKQPRPGPSTGPSPGGSVAAPGMAGPLGGRPGPGGFGRPPSPSPSTLPRPVGGAVALPGSVQRPSLPPSSPASRSEWDEGEPDDEDDSAPSTPLESGSAPGRAGSITLTPIPTVPAPSPKPAITGSITNPAAPARPTPGAASIGSGMRPSPRPAGSTVAGPTGAGMRSSPRPAGGTAAGPGRPVPAVPLAPAGTPTDSTSNDPTDSAVEVLEVVTEDDGSDDSYVVNPVDESAASRPPAPAPAAGSGMTGTPGRPNSASQTAPGGMPAPDMRPGVGPGPGGPGMGRPSRPGAGPGPGMSAPNMEPGTGPDPAAPGMGRPTGPGAGSGPEGPSMPTPSTGPGAGPGPGGPGMGRPSGPGGRPGPGGPGMPAPDVGPGVGPGPGLGPGGPGMGRPSGPGVRPGPGGPGGMSAPSTGPGAGPDPGPGGPGMGRPSGPGAQPPQPGTVMIPPGGTSATGPVSTGAATEDVDDSGDDLELNGGRGSTPSTATEAGPRPGINASSPAGAGGFTLSPVISRVQGAVGAALGAAAAGNMSAAVSGLANIAAAGADLYKAPKASVTKQPGAKETVLVGCALPFAGDQEVSGKAAHAALQMALQDFAQTVKPPVNVNLTCLNTKCIDIPAFRATQQLIKEGAIAVFGDICSGATVAAAGVAGESKVPLISPAASSPQLTGMPFFFRTVPSDRYQGAAAAHMARKMGLKTMGMVYEDASYGFGLAFNFIASFTRDGGTVPAVYTFKKGPEHKADDAQTAVAKMLQAKTGRNSIDGVFVSTNNLTFFAEFIRAAGKSKLGLPILSGDAAASPTVARLLEDNLGLLQGVTVTTFSQGSAAFQQKFAKAHPEVEFEGVAAQAYDAMHTLLKAYSAAPPPKEPQDVAQLIPKQNFTGVSGPVMFDRVGSVPSADLLPHDDTYIKMTFDTKTGALKNGGPIPLS